MDIEGEKMALEQINTLNPSPNKLFQRKINLSAKLQTFGKAKNVDKLEKDSKRQT